jgi:hypothetical protein
MAIFLNEHEADHAKEIENLHSTIRGLRADLHGQMTQCDQLRGQIAQGKAAIHKLHDRLTDYSFERVKRDLIDIATEIL